MYSAALRQRSGKLNGQRGESGDKGILESVVVVLDLRY